MTRPGDGQTPTPAQTLRLLAPLVFATLTGTDFVLSRRRLNATAAELGVAVVSGRFTDADDIWPSQDLTLVLGQGGRLLGLVAIDCCGQPVVCVAAEASTHG